MNEVMGHQTAQMLANLLAVNVPPGLPAAVPEVAVRTRARRKLQADSERVRLLINGIGTGRSSLLRWVG